MTIYNVSPAGSDSADGVAVPFRTINRAAEVAIAGDTVVVHEGVYREWVKPRNGGSSNTRRITYQAAPGAHVAIVGSEPVGGWQHQHGDLWSTELPADFFTDGNPFAMPIEGDWVVRPIPGDERPKHLGEVYLDGMSFYEADSLADLESVCDDTVVDDWTGVEVPVPDSSQTRHRWYADVAADGTTSLWATFPGADPNEHLVEVNARRSVFYPEVTGIDYITVRGFELAQAACPWTPPTADQPALIGPNWAKGWVIEDNDIHDAKCSAISIGKEASTGDNDFTKRHEKPGYQYQLEAVFAARQIGWSKEQIGSHTIRRNHIHHCGQNGIVGHLGCVFSVIEDNHIHDIAVKREFYGHEIAGIKLHAAIDVTISHNRIHDCSLGLWLDWQAQGSRITRNLCYDNSRDLFIEVSHGPYVVDHNILASEVSIELMSEGGLFVRNLVCGSLRVQPVLDRATPYHVPHSTEVAGFAVIYGGDDRYIGNLFVGRGSASPLGVGYRDDRKRPDRVDVFGYGTSVYDGHPDSAESYLRSVEAALPGDVEIYLELRQPVYVHDNAYLAGARPFDLEPRPVVVEDGTRPSIRTVGSEVWLDLDLPAEVVELQIAPVRTSDLEHVRFVNADFEGPDGSVLVLDTDLLGDRTAAQAPIGPLNSLASGRSTTLVWTDQA
mgnify:CR=1 FL=1